jgi:hypothetical protein
MRGGQIGWIVAVLSCFDGTARGQALLRTHEGPSTGGAFGWKVASLPDLDGDGIVDYAISDPWLGFHAGTIDVFSGASGATLFTIQGSGSGSFGWAICDAGDVNGDGISDLLAGDPRIVYDGSHGGYEQTGRIQSCSGADGATILDLKLDLGSGGDSPVQSVVDFDDIDGDGAREVLGMSATWSSNGESIDIVVRVCSLATGTVLREDQFYGGLGAEGGSIDALSDSTDDGIQEYVVGSTSGAHVVDGRTGHLLYELATTAYWCEGTSSVRTAGDLNGDGRADFLVGDGGFEDPQGVARGRVSVLGGNDFWLNASPKSARENDLVTLTARSVPVGNPIGIAIVDVSGTPLFQLLALGPADSTEALVLSGWVPAGLSGPDRNLSELRDRPIEARDRQREGNDRLRVARSRSAQDEAGRQLPVQRMQNQCA